MKITNPNGPNTTILLPGPCNASCDFCFWNHAEGKIIPPENYLDKIMDGLSALPNDFRVLSISGGEPTISPLFGRFLARLAKHRRNHKLNRVVLTTNGTNLEPFIGAIGCVVDHINISRHGIATGSNQKIFKTKAIPNDMQLDSLIQQIHQETDCDVTLNCVIQPETTVKFCYQFVDYAKSLGADAVSFRKAASDVTPTFAEEFFRNLYGVEAETKCPVCRGMEQIVDGFVVRWKGTVNEPSIESNGIYEVVFHPDGEPYADWGMKIPVEFVPIKSEPRLPVSGPSFGGCGSSGLVGC